MRGRRTCGSSPARPTPEHIPASSPRWSSLGTGDAPLTGALPAWPGGTYTCCRGARIREMSEPFKGTINIDIRDSVPDWTPFEPPKAPAGAPNVVYIVLDDVGFSAMNSYGGPIPTPNIDRIAPGGGRYTPWAPP